MTRTTRNTAFRNKQKGLTIIELLIAIGVALVLAAIAFGALRFTREEQRITQVQNQILQVTNTVQALGSAGEYSGINADVLCGSGKIPSNWCSGTAGSRVIRHAFSGEITLTAGALAAAGAAPAVTAATTPRNGVQVTLAGLTPSVCNSLVNNMQASYRGVRTDTGVIRNIDAALATPAAITTNCTPGSGDTVDVSFFVG